MGLLGSMHEASTSADSVLKHAEVNFGKWFRTVRARGDRLDPVKKTGRHERLKPSLAEEKTSECLQTMIDGFEDEVVIVESDFRVRQANSAVLRRLGMSAPSIAGRLCFEVIRNAEEPCRSPWSECPLGKVLHTAQTVHVIHAPRDGDNAGEGRWVEVIASPLRDGYGRITEVIELRRDISESMKLRRELLKADRGLLGITVIAQLLSRSSDLEKTMKGVADAMLDALEAELSWVRLSDNGTGISVTSNRHNLPARADDNLAEAMCNTMPTGQASCATYYLKDTPRNGVLQIPRHLAWTAISRAGSAIGTVGVVSVRGPFQKRDIQLLDAIGNEIGMSVDRCRLNEEVRESRELRGELLRRATTTQEEERRRIARDLHDETGQILTALRLDLEKLALSPPGVKGGKACIAQSLELCRQAEEEVDRLIHDLRPALLDFGLVEAIDSYAETHLTPARIRVSTRVDGVEQRLSDAQETSVFRVAQESITNIVRHAQAKEVHVVLRFDAERFSACIEDDGCGFDVDQVGAAQSSRPGLGLLGMKERIELLGGNLSIESQMGRGTRVTAVIPLD